MSGDGQSVEQSRPGVKCVVAGRQDAGQDNSVDEASCRLRAGHLEDESKGRGAGVFAGETGSGVRDVETENEDGKDVEEQDAPKDVADDFGEDLGGILGLAAYDGDAFGTTI